jgi:hypothetical protein
MSIISRRALFGVLTLIVLVMVAGAAPAAFATEPWWHMTSGARPTYLAPGGEGTIVVMAEDFGDARVDGTKVPVTITDTLPKGLQALSVVGAEVLGNTQTPLSCSKSPVLKCVWDGFVAPYQQLEVRIRVRVGAGAHSGEVNRGVIAGGGAPVAVVERPITVSEEPTPFGSEDYELRAEEEGGSLDTQAGSHPFQVTGTVGFNQGAETISGGKPVVFPAALAKDIDTLLPPGLIGDPTPFATCSTAQFTHIKAGAEVAEVGNPVRNECPARTAVGVASVTVEEPDLIGFTTFTVPVFNLVPAFGEPARFAFVIPAAGVIVTLDTSLRSGPGEDYGITVSAPNTTQEAGLTMAKVTFWGVPGDPRHDSSRGWSCLSESEGLTHGLCTPSEDEHPPAFLTMPTACNGPLRTSLVTNPWIQQSAFGTYPSSEPLQALDGCNRLPFNPTMSAEPSTDRASAPSGLDFNLDFHDEGLTSAEGLAQSQLNKTVVKLPEGLTINPSAGVGLGGCTPADYARETVDSEPGAGCPNDSKLGTVEIETPLLTQKIHGSIFIASPYDNPSGSLVALYVVAKNAETGILIRLAGRVDPDPVTGRLTTTFENNPPLAFSHFNFHFREGQQAPLISPSRCGTYTTEALLSPWSEPSRTLTDTSSFTVTKGFDGGPCPSGGVPPFHPQIQAGTLNNNAGAFSSFYLHLTRNDADQQISGFSTDLPAGLTGDLSGIPFCPESDIALARTKTGAQEQAGPSCPAASELGHSLVGTGVGAVLAYTPGKVYLAGPYAGDPFSLVSVTSAVVGPFDLGTVVIRFGLRIDPHTARVSVDPTASEPIPTIIKGIVTHVRDIRVYIDRQNFILNPTSCNPLAIGNTLSAHEGASATVSSPFQLANCSNLKFTPKFAVSTSGKNSKAGGASLSVKLSYPAGSLGRQANIAKVKVELPKQLPSRLTTLQKACTAAQFDSNPAGCPAASVIGHAKAITPILPVPIEGPAYFVSNGGEAFPNLVLVLQGYGVTIDLVGDTFISKQGVTSSTFKTVPDQPVSSFELTLPQGPYSALAALGDLCKQKLSMPTEFVGQNGMVIHQTTPVGVGGCPKKKGLTRTQKLALALKACHRKAKSKRAACERSAHRKYGPQKRKKK